MAWLYTYLHSDCSVNMELLIALCCIPFLFWLICKLSQPPVPDLREELGRVKEQHETVEKALQVKCQQHLELSEKYDKLFHQKKSSEVRTGFISEALLPLTEQFPCDPKSLRFLGAPVDYISFDYEKNEITFIECKTGESQLNDNQKKVRNMVEQGRVKFVTVRLNEKGIKVK